MTSTEIPVAGLTTRPATGTTWRDGAPCGQTDPELFFPERGTNPRTAIAICMTCDVRTRCLEWALTHHETGVWGGTTERERRRMLRTTPGQPVLLDAGRLIRDHRIRRLTAEGLTAEEVAAQVGCHSRTVERVRTQEVAA